MKVANVGNDVAKRWFDICVLLDDQPHEKRFPNTPLGCVQCVDWLSSFGADKINVVLEPTGRYSELIANYLFKQQSITVYQAHPFRFDRFKNSLDFRIKADKKDAWALAVYAEERIGKKDKYPPTPYVPKSPVQKELRDIRVRLRSLYKRKSMLESQLESGFESKTIKADTESELAQIEQRIDGILDFAKGVIESDSRLSRDVELLDSIIGIGWKTALALVCLVDFRKFKSSRDLACFVGLSNRKKSSGTSIHGKDRISKAGDKYIRAALYFPAMTAMQFNPQLRDFARRLQSKGKLHPVIRTAVAHKLITTAWALIQNDTPYDAHYVRSAA